MSISPGKGIVASILGINIWEPGTVAPTSATLGDLWVDTTSGAVLKICTTAPSTFEAVEGGAGSFTNLAATGTFTLSGTITPTTLAANTDNWAPTGLSGASVIRVSTDTSRNLTGITGGADGRVLILQNVGSNPLVLIDDATSTAANRFQLSANVTVGANQVAIVQYDATDSRWRMIAGPSASGGQGDWIAADSGSAPTVAPVAAGSDAVAIGDATVASADHALAMGAFANSGVTPGAYSVAIGSDDSATDNTQALGLGAIAIGSSSGSTGNGARATINHAIAIGCGGSTSGDGASATAATAIAIGSGAAANAGAASSGTGAVAIGSANTGGVGAVASAAGSVAIGGAETTAAGAAASATNAIAVGLKAIASATDSIAIGETCSATTGTGNIAIGSDASVTGTVGAIGIGDGVIASGTSSIAIGTTAEADATGAIGIGAFANSGITAGTYSIAIGSDDSATDNTQATGPGAIAIGSSGGSTGDGARATGTAAIAVGSTASGSPGSAASSSGNGAIAIGSGDLVAGPVASATGAVAIGSAASTALGALASTAGAIAIGAASEADGTSAIALGYFVNSGTTAGAYSIAIGSDDSNTDNTRATGAGGIALGSSQGSTGNGALASGPEAIAIGCGSTSSGNGPVASSNSAIAIGSAEQGTGAGASSSQAGGIAIGGARSNTAGASTSGANSLALIGGDTTLAGATVSTYGGVAIGAGAVADRVGEFALQNSDASAVTGRTGVFRWTGTTSNNTPTEIFLLGQSNARLTLPSDSSMFAVLYTAARRTDADGESAGFTTTAILDNNAGTTAGAGATAFVTTATSSDFTTATVTASADNTNDALAVTVTGETSKTIRWVVTGVVTEAKG